MVTAIPLVVALLAAEPAPERPNLLVLDLVAEHGIDEGIVRLLNELLLSEFQKTGRYEVMGRTDVKTMMSHEQERAVLECKDDFACLAEIGGALGAQYLASANIGRVGDYYLLNVKVLDVRAAKVARRWSTQVEGIENKLMAAVRQSVAAVSSEEEPAAVPGGKRSMTWLPWLGVGLTVAAGGTGGVLVGLAHSDSAAARKEFEGTPAWQNHKDAAETKGVGAGIALGVAGAAAIGTVALFLLGGDEESATAVSFAPTRDGSFATVAIPLE